ncbi:MAG: tetratricopeptide repeat protein [Candidatus Aminicenantes bacterium]|nr:tetratricopeptide repeat protein [Candidatus Aminicenantes bacterium]
MVDGNLVSQYQKMIRHLKKNLYLIRDIYSDKPEDYDIPEIVFRELLANAFIHREYQSHISTSYIQVELYPDRLEIKNPGNFHDAIDIKTLGKVEKSYVRNLEISLVFFLHKFVERAGKGIKRIQEVLLENGMKPADFKQEKKGNFVTATVFRKKPSAGLKGKEETQQSEKRKVTLLTALPRKIKLIGRDKDLSALAEMLKKAERVVLVNGLGGVGKTEVCKSFFYSHYNEYVYAAWIDWISSLRESLVHGLGGDDSQFIQAGETDTVDELFKKIMTRLRQMKESFLLVVDDIEHPGDADLDALASLPPQVKVLVNSRSFIEGYVVQSLDYLSPGECRALFYEFYKGKRDDEVVKKIVELCGYHTLSVELLAKTAYHAAMSIGKLYESLKSKGFNLNEVASDKVATIWHNEKEKKRFFDHLVKVFDISGVTEEGLSVLVNMSVLPAVYIPMEWVREWLKLKDNNSVVSLVEKGWLKRDEEMRLYMHPVMQEVVRFRAKPDVQKCKTLIISLANKLSLEPGDNPILKKEYILYGESVVRALAMEAEEKDEDLATLANNLSLRHKDMGQLDRALEFQLKALAIREAVLDKNHPDLATSYNNLSWIYRDMKDYASALPYAEKAVDILQFNFPNGHPNLDGAKRNLEVLKKLE